jgi:hypothetical protein
MPLTGMGDSGACLISELMAGDTEHAPLSGCPGAHAGKAVGPAGSVSLSRSGAYAVLWCGQRERRPGLQQAALRMRFLGLSADAKLAKEGKTARGD